jgi:hypothetical protein
MKCNLFLIVIIILLIFIIIYNNENKCTIVEYDCDNNHTNSVNNYLDGYWISSDDFNNMSDISKMILYIDMNNNLATLIIIIDNRIATNEKYYINIDEDNIKHKNGVYLMDILFKAKNNKNLIWNNQQFKCSLNINSGNIQFVDRNDTLYGDFIKDNQISNFISKI